MAVPRLKEKFEQEIIPIIMADYSLRNRFEVPRLEKITVNMGVGEALQNPKALDTCLADLAIITGQKPKINRAKKSIAGFKLREGVAIGCKVTLRGSRMYEFLDRLISVALPRIRDFRGLNPKSFDGWGNYSLGVDEQLIFPEIDYDKVERVRGMDITFTTTGLSDELSYALLKQFGLPLKERKSKAAVAG